MLKNIKELYDKYILMDEMFNNLRRKLEAAEKRIAVLESIVNKPIPSKYACRACADGIYRPVSLKQRSMSLATAAQRWQCDKCGDTAEHLS